MNFEFTDEQISIRNMVRDFARERIAPMVMENDNAKTFPADLIAELGELGLLGIFLPEAYGGSGMGYVEYALIIEELAAVDPSIALSVAAHNSLGTNHIYTFGTEPQRRKYVTHLTSGKSLASWALTEPVGGSDAAGMKTTAHLEDHEWVLNGSKTFITNPNYSDFHVVMAKTDPDKGKAGISAFVVEKGTPGFTVGAPMDKLGMRASDTAELFLQDCRIPRSNLLGDLHGGYYNALSILDGGRISIGAMSVGVARGAFEHSVRYSQERHAFGKAIHSFQAIKFKLADMATRIDAARLLIMRAASMKDNGQDVGLEAAMGKLFASELAVEVANEAIQVYGGYGYIKEYPVEKFYRDAKLGTIGEGTSEVLRLVIARDVVKKYSIALAPVMA